MKKVCLFIIYLFVLVACDQNSQGDYLRQYPN